MSYEDIKNFLGNPLVATAIGLISAFLGWKYGHRRPRPTVWITSAKQLTWGGSDGAPETFEIRYRGTSITRVSRGTLVFWNAGNDTLEYSSISANDRFRLSIPDGDFLEVEVLRASADKTGVSLHPSPDNREVEIRFEYLDPSEGISIAFLHTSEQTHPDVLGRIRGARIKFFNSKSNFEIGKIISSKALSSALILTGILFFCFLALRIFNPEFFGKVVELSVNKESVSASFFLAFLGFVYLFLGGSMLWQYRRRYPKSLEYREENLTSPQQKIPVSAKLAEDIPPQFEVSKNSVLLINGYSAQLGDELFDADGTSIGEIIALSEKAQSMMMKRRNGMIYDIKSNSPEAIGLDIVPF
jgi:hypothetical protein